MIENRFKCRQFSANQTLFKIQYLLKFNSTGPEVRGCRPVLVAFETFKDRETVLKQSKVLKRANIDVTEDFSRKIRRHREELIKFAREVRSRDPCAKCLLQYDRLHVEGEVFLFNEVEGRVEKVMMKIKEG